VTDVVIAAVLTNGRDYFRPALVWFPPRLR
jgi:hypothetical protein